MRLEVRGKIRARDAARQNQADHLAHLRKARLVRVREQIQSFVGPAFNFAMAAQMAIVKEICDPDLVERLSGFRPRKSMWTVSDGAVAKYNRDHPKEAFTFKTYVSMDCNHIHSLVGEEYEDVLRQQPDSPAAKYYRRWLRRITIENWNPLHDLIMKHSQALDERPGPDEFKEKFGKAVKSPLLRNSLYLHTLLFIEEMRDVLRDWDAGDYSRMFPESHPLPVQMFRYFVSQITALRDKETEMGAAEHALVRDDTTGKGSMLDKVVTHLEQQAEAEDESKSGNAAGKEKKTSKISKKYAVAAVATGSAVVAAVSKAAAGE
eukprot:g1396.t1